MFFRIWMDVWIFAKDRSWMLEHDFGPDLEPYCEWGLFYILKLENFSFDKFFLWWQKIYAKRFCWYGIFSWDNEPKFLSQALYSLYYDFFFHFISLFVVTQWDMYFLYLPDYFVMPEIEKSDKKDAFRQIKQEF